MQFILQYLYHLKNVYCIIKCYTAEDSALCSALHDNMPTHCMLLLTVNWHLTIWPATDMHMFLNKLYPLVYKVQLVLPIISTFPSFHIPRSEHHKTETQTVCILKIKTSLAHFTFHYYKFLLTVNAASCLHIQHMRSVFILVSHRHLLFHYRPVVLSHHVSV